MMKPPGNHKGRHFVFKYDSYLLLKRAIAFCFARYYVFCHISNEIPVSRHIKISKDAFVAHTKLE